MSSILAKVYQISYNKGELRCIMSEGAISLLYEKGPKDECKNYRSITLIFFIY